MKDFLQRVGLILVFFIISFELVQLKFQKEPRERDPASVGSDLSLLSGEQLTSEIKKSILVEFSAVIQVPWLYVTLGHYQFRDTDDKVKWACESYDKVRLKFVAESAVDGRVTEMLLDAKCYFMNGARVMETIKIPLKTIVDEYEPNDGEISFNYEVPVTVNFKNLPGLFPKTWYLEKIELMKSNGDTFEINSADLSDYKKNIKLDL